MPISILFENNMKVRAELEIDPADPEVAILHLGRQIDENFDHVTVMRAFSALPTIKRVHLDLAKTRRINSPGTRVWIQLVDELQRRFAVELSHVSEPLMDLSSMIPDVFGRPRVKIGRVEVPLHCPKCESTYSPEMPVSELVSAGRITIPPRQCPRCQETLKLDVVGEEYFGAFLKREPR